MVFTSDHGEQLGDHHLLGKLGYFDQSFRIPLVVREPGTARAGTVEDSFTESIDVFPTVVDWLGGTPPRACDGRSLVPFLRTGRPERWRTELHYEYDFRDVHYSSPEHELGLTMDECSLLVVQDARWKYVHFAALPPLLFDLGADPDQLHDLAGDPAHLAPLAEYRAKALSWRMNHADRTLTHFRSSPRGLEVRDPQRSGDTP